MIKSISQHVVSSTPEHMGRTELTEEIGVDENGHQWRRYHTRFILDEQYKTSVDLAWPAQRAAIEISRQKRPADTNDWAVGQIQPTMTNDQIDEILKTLPL